MPVNENLIRLREFDQADVPPYAILSHTWETSGEVTLLDVHEGIADSRNGYHKLVGCCAQAVSDGIDYVWIDTCCIDKTSSAELTEAINSMFEWYRDAEICYAYLQDVDSKVAQDYFSSSFNSSRWFTRGWTLQELIAPRRLIFLGSDWKEIGSRSDMVKTISEITGIDRYLFDHGVLSRYSIAQRMSWASRRETTRIEDKAYCLLGIFGVTMPLVYGEGEMAFIRLQEEIMRRSDDHSIFAWTTNTSTMTGILASSPVDFAESGEIIKVDQADNYPPYAITNKGIQITLQVIKPQADYKLPFIPFASDKLYGTSNVGFAFTPAGTLAFLSCKTAAKGTRVGIYLDRSHPMQPYQRSDHSLGLISIPVEDIESYGSQDTILVRASDPRDEKPLWPSLSAEQLIIIKSLPSPTFGFNLTDTFPKLGNGPKWITYESGVMAVRVATSGFLAKTGLLFTNAAGRSFGLFVEPGDDMISTDLVVNLGEAHVKELKQGISHGRLAEKQEICRREQETGRGLESVMVTVETKMRPHGALVWIRIDTDVAALGPPSRKRLNQSLDVFREGKRVKA